MRSHEHPVLPLLRQAEIIWRKQTDIAPVPVRVQKNITRLFEMAKDQPDVLSVRAQDLDSAVRLFNHLRRRSELRDNESRTLAQVLPKEFRLPTFGQLSRNTRQSKPFFDMMISRLQRGDYGFTQNIAQPDTLGTLAILSGYSLATHRQLAFRRHAVGSGFDNILVSGLSTMLNPESALYRDIFRADA